MRAVRIATDYSRIDSCGSEPYLVAWPLDNDPAALTPALAAAVAAAVPGLPVVLVAENDDGDVVTFGDAKRSLLAAKLDLSRRLWELVEVDVPVAAPPSVACPLPVASAGGSAAAGGCSTWR